MSIWVAVTSASCQKRYDLGIPRIPYTGNELKINGYYYSFDTLGRNTSTPRIDIDIILFYRNGIVMKHSVEADGTDTLQLIEGHLHSMPTEWMLKTSSGFGTFVILNNTLQLSYWGKAWDYDSFRYDALILNDSTFITKGFFINNQSRTDWNGQIYHFKQYSPKPDSTCVFIE